MEQGGRIQQRAADVRLLHETARGTPMGDLLRTFWQPIARSQTVVKGKARAIRVMGEDLTIYRGDSGTPFLVGGFCAHRRTVLHTGWVQGDQLRCMYHGWRYDGSGLCTEIPAETKPRATPVEIGSYPLHEYCGLVFAYMGEGPAPEFQLPTKHFLDEPGRHTVVLEQVWDFNWFQQVENSLDAVHLSYCHAWGTVSRFEEEISTAIPTLHYLETPAGIRQTATRSESNVRVSDWTFPNNNHVVVPGPNKGDPWSDLSVWAVPIDDERTMRFYIYSFPASAAKQAQELANDPDRDYNPADHRDELLGKHVIQDVGHTQVLAAQDYVALRGQGVIADRVNENLSVSDAGIMLFRRICWREIENMRAGKPTKQWARLAEKGDLPIPGAVAVN
jgi:5,5'-dehydrodivanillate O-demethylase